MFMKRAQPMSSAFSVKKSDPGTVAGVTSKGLSPNP